jgi:hypothetical protein
VFLIRGGFQLQTTTNWVCSSLRIPALRDVVNSPPLNLIGIYSHPTECIFLFVLFPVLWMISKDTFWITCLVAALAVSRRTNSCLHSCRVARIAVVDVEPANLPVFDPLSPGGGGCVTMSCWCGIGEEDDNEGKWEALRTISLASCQKGISSSPHDCYTQDESC